VSRKRTGYDGGQAGVVGHWRLQPGGILLFLLLLLFLLFFLLLLLELKLPPSAAVHLSYPPTSETHEVRCLSEVTEIERTASMPSTPLLSCPCPNTSPYSGRPYSSTGGLPHCPGAIPNSAPSGMGAFRPADPNHHQNHQSMTPHH
jgi:hypothetical protein